MYLVGATVHKGKSAQLAMLGCCVFEQQQKFKGREGVGVVIDLYNSLVAEFAESIVYNTYTAVQEQDIESVKLLLNFRCEINDAGLIVEVEGYNSNLDT